MQQPELGKKIAELRKSKGLTQEELVELCKLNVRTLQRIESGDVTPRSYSLKVLAKALDFEFKEFTDEKHAIRRFVENAWDCINFKNNTMKKVGILSTSLLVVLLAAFMINFIRAENIESALKEQIIQQNKNSIEWFNSGQIDRLLEDYAETACFYRNAQPSYCGKEEIRRILFQAVDAKLFTMIGQELLSLNVDGDLAIEKSLTISKLRTGERLKTINMQEWQNIDGKWMIVNDIDVLIDE